MNRLRCIFAATLSAMVLGACGGSGAFSPAASGGATVGANLYVASSRNSTVTLYALGSKSVIRTISQGLAAPANLAVDGSGNLFVANRVGDTITIYARGSNQLLRTISEGISSPNGLAFDRSGNLYVAQMRLATPSRSMPQQHENDRGSLGRAEPRSWGRGGARF